MKLKISLLALAFAFAFVPALSFAAPENFGGDNGKAWDEDTTGHFINLNNRDNRKDWVEHQFAAPGNAGDHANENSAVRYHENSNFDDGVGMLVVPKNDK